MHTCINIMMEFNSIIFQFYAYNKKRIKQNTMFYYLNVKYRKLYIYVKPFYLS